MLKDEGGADSMARIVDKGDVGLRVLIKKNRFCFSKFMGGTDFRVKGEPRRKVRRENGVNVGIERQQIYWMDVRKHWMGVMA